MSCFFPGCFGSCFQLQLAVAETEGSEVVDDREGCSPQSHPRSQAAPPAIKELLFATVP